METFAINMETLAPAAPDMASAYRAAIAAAPSAAIAITIDAYNEARDCLPPVRLCLPGGCDAWGVGEAHDHAGPGYGVRRLWVWRDDAECWAFLGTVDQARRAFVALGA